MDRYEAGETLASIARTYDCSPPAISYVVSRSRARHPDARPPAVPTSAVEPRLIKAATADGIGNPPDLATPAASPQSSWGSPPAETPAAPPDAAAAILRPGTGERNASFPGLPPRATPGPQRPAVSPLPVAQANGDQRRTLHLSLGNGGTHAAEPQPAAQHGFGGFDHHSQPQAPLDPSPPLADPAAQSRPAAPERNYDSAAQRGFSEARPADPQGAAHAVDGHGAPRREAGGAFIGKELRARVEGDIAAFLAAFDAALVQDTQESRSALREATDRLLRAGARTRIELERLEARMPLPPRDNGGRGEPTWRHR